MNMKSKAEKRKERLNMFRDEILPLLLKKYKVQAHGPKNAPQTMYKIIVGMKSYDYYPMAEKMRENNVDGSYKWHEMSIEEIRKRASN